MKQHVPSGSRWGFGKRGSIVVLAAIGSVFFLGLTALVTDTGWIQYQKGRLETSVNAGWKAGFDQMMKLMSASNQPLDESGQALVRAKVLEVMSANGMTSSELSQVQVNFGPGNYLQVTSSQTVGLFFAKVLGFTTTRVGAERGDPGDGSGLTVIPLAIPHGVTKDLSKTTYGIDFFGDPGTMGTEGVGPDEGFASGTEYILKLGSGNGTGTIPLDIRMILVPMDDGAQTSAGFLKAYGVAFWCLKIDENDPGFVPVYWLLGYRGGSFFLPYHDDILGILKKYSVNYDVITGRDPVQAIFDAVNPNCLELFNRPRIAVYSSQSDPDPVEQVLRDAYIPYGTYGLPPAVNGNGWTRTAVYDSARANRLYDTEIFGGALDNYQWVHLHHEDFTGFSGGCYLYESTCKSFYEQTYSNGFSPSLGLKNTTTRRKACAERMCTYCKGKFNTSSESFGTYVAASCLNYRRRCAEKAKYTGVLWSADANIKICNDDADRPQCREFPALQAAATAAGFGDEAGSTPKPRTQVKTDGTLPLGDNVPGWFDQATRVQQLKWEVARKIRNHVEVGGFLFAQCFAPETLDLALWQAAIHDGAAPSAAYEDCIAFTDFHYKTFPWRSGNTWYSDINSRDGGEVQDFSLVGLPVEPRIQNHTGTPDTSRGHTASFMSDRLKSTVTVLGSDNGASDQKKYIWGTKGTGNFTFLGGHYLQNVNTKRLVLNNVLLGSLVDKDLGVGTPTTVTGKSKSNYGVVDPDNVTAGGANDYRDRFMYGFNQALQMNDRIMTEGGNMVGPTDQSVEFRVNGDGTYPPHRRVLVPITDVPPEVPVNNTHNASATSIYDIQGMDHPGGVYDPALYGFGSSVRIVGFAEFEILDPSEYTRAGSNIQPGDAGDLGGYQSGQVRGKFIRYIVKPGDVPLH